MVSHSPDHHQAPTVRKPKQPPMLHRFALPDCEGGIYEGNCFVCLRNYIKKRNDFIRSLDTMISVSRVEVRA